MLTDTPEGRALIEDISRAVISEVAPEELDLFDQLSEEYYADPTPPDLTQNASDDALGFGLGDLLIASTPASNAMITVVLTFAIQILMQAAGDEGSDFVRDRVRALFGRKGQAEPPPHFNRDELRHMRAAAESEAQRFGLSAEEAGHMADALFRRMALGE
jgi:hypothetical protein